MSATVKIIGICGHPQHGKSTAQRFLEPLGVQAVDDSEPLRRLTMERYGLTWDEVSTQEGKAKLVSRPDNDDTVTVRQALGDLGKEYETEHGPNYWMERAIASVAPGSLVSFGSVRMGQAHAIRAAGGLTIAIHDPRRPNSTHDFDQYDPAGVDDWIRNDSTLWTFEYRVIEACATYLGVDFREYWKQRQQDEMAASYIA
ncbi:hypothetical protein [Sphingomonas sp. ACRSK]|uniref:hypothetical protein n=1 Tax=Sphingomonas sp. ACRSK TaxID=2918213 RepID=UPI001EF63D0D|nr:hypothetical protein [Sphingomonas sp. ACRSK]MCG7349007.1 hypothetical protein [Sphingomonas sp. ACRSK]